jgi:hypothetical protein
MTAIRFETTISFIVLLAVPALFYVISIPFPRLLKDPLFLLGILGLVAFAIFRGHWTNIKMETKWRPESVAFSETGIHCRYRDGRQRVVPWKEIRDVKLIPGTRFREGQAILYGHDGKMMNDPLFFEEAAEVVVVEFQRYRERLEEFSRERP